MNTDIVRVVRILEYVGPEAQLKRALMQNAVQGTRQFGDITVREATLPNWEVVGEQPKEEPTRFSQDMDGSMVPDEDGEWVRYG